MSLKNTDTDFIDNKYSFLLDTLIFIYVFFGFGAFRLRFTEIRTNDAQFETQIVWFLSVKQKEEKCIVVCTVRKNTAVYSMQ